MSTYEGTNLVGDVKYDGNIVENGNKPNRLIRFLEKLEILMVTYKISKVDICFTPNWKSILEGYDKEER